MATAKAKWSRKSAKRAASFIKSRLTDAEKIELCGSYRRGCDSVGDLDFVVVPKRGEESKLINQIHGLAKEVLADGQNTIRIVGDSGIQADFMIVRKDNFESAVLHSTGDKWFNIQCRARAKMRGFKLNQYGLFDKETNKRLAKTELGILESISMSRFINPKDRSM